MKKTSRLILPLVLVATGITAVIVGRLGQVSADNIYYSEKTPIYLLLSASGFLLIAVAIIVLLFMLASGRDR